MYQTKTFKLTKESIWSVLLLLFITSLFLPFGQAIRYFLLGAFTFVSIIISIKERQERFVISRYAYSFLFIFLFLAFLLFSFFTSDQSDGFRAIRIRLPLFLFPLIFFFITIPRNKRDKLLLNIAVITTISCFISLNYAIIQAIQKEDNAWLYNDALSFFINQQSIYTSLLVNISIYIFTYFLLTQPKSYKHKFLLITGIGFLFIISYLLASRIMMLQLYGTFFLLLVFYIYQKKKWLQGIALLAATLLAIFLVFSFFPKTFNRFKELAFTSYQYDNTAQESHYGGVLTEDQWNGANFRLAAWKCGWELFTKKPLTGVGIGDKTSELNALYKQKRFWFAIETGKNVHNNYLDILYSMGLVGLVLFLLGWFVLPFRSFVKQQDYLAIIITITFAFAMITEVYFDRSLGAILFGFFIPFLLSGSKRTIPLPSAN
jgi:O-antigen ligase